MLNLSEKLQLIKRKEISARSAKFFLISECAMRNRWENFCKLRFFVEKLDIVIESEKHILLVFMKCRFAKGFANLID